MNEEVAAHMGVRQVIRGGQHAAAGGGGQLQAGWPCGEPGSTEEPRAWFAAGWSAAHIQVRIPLHALI